MGVELHITRAEFWAENDGVEISPEEWLRYVQSDPELHIDEENGEHFAVWSGPSAHEEAWLDWDNGNISTKWPDTALYRKMLVIAKVLKAKVQDDDGTDYTAPSDWTFNPDSPMRPTTAKSSFWRRLLGRT